MKLGVLSIHLQGGRCRVGCPFCYLGQRTDPSAGGLDLIVLRQALSLGPGPGPALRPAEVAVAVSEPVEQDLPALSQIATLCQEVQVPLTVTTTLAGAAALPAWTRAQVVRLNLSVDPFKGGGAVQAAEVAQAVADLRRGFVGEVVLIVSLSTQRFAQALIGGLLAELVALDGVDRVALNGIKPPPAWCDRAFWLRALSLLQPLLRSELDRRLFLDCYVAARILGIGGCPARPDLSPGPGPGQVAFRSCVYQAAPDFVVRSGQELGPRLSGFAPPAVCPFPVE